MPSVLSKIFSLFFAHSSKKTLSEEHKIKIRSEWRGVEELIKVGGPSSVKQAVIKADKIMGYALTNLTGLDTLAGALKVSRELFSSYKVYDDLWQAHRMRNTLVHDLSNEPSYYSLMRAVKRFRVALEDLVNGL